MNRRQLLALAAGLAIASVTGCAVAPPPEPAAKRAPLLFPSPPDEPRYEFERAIYGSADVVLPDQQSSLRQALTGEGSTSEGLGKPYAVAVHQGRVYVSDSAERFIKVFDFTQGKYSRVGDGDPGRILKPLGIDVDRAGRLYVADASARDIKIFAPDGKYVKSIGGMKWFDRLASVTVEPGGERIYVVDIGGVTSTNHRIRVFEVESGKHLFDFGKRGAGPGELNLPRDLAIGKDGQLYVVDGGNFRVQVFTRDGQFVKSFGAVGKQFGQFARPKEIASDAQGHIYVVDSAFGNFQVFNPEGQLLMFVGNRGERDGPARYMLPSGIYVDEDGRIYMVDQWFRKVEVFRPVSLAADQGFLGRIAKAKPPAAKP